MSNFWQLNDGTTAESNPEFSAGGGEFEPIPDNTGCIAAIEEVKWDGMQGSSDDWIKIKWRIIRPEIYGNRVVFQKLKVFGTSMDKDPKATSDKAKRMLAAIDANAGGGLMALENTPSSDDLMRCLSGKMMAIKLQIWKMKINGEDKTGNWVSAVAPAKSASAQTAPAPAAKSFHEQFHERTPADPANLPPPRAVAQTATAAQAVPFDDSIPF